MKLRYKLSLFIFLLVSGLTISLVWIGAERETSEKQRKLSELSRNAAKMLAAVRISGTIDHAQGSDKIPDSVIPLIMGIDRTIAYVLITDSEGRVIGGDINDALIEYDRSIGKRAFLDRIVSANPVHPDLKTVSVDIVREGKPDGVIRAAFSLRQSRRELLEMKRTTIALGAAALVAGLYGAFLIASRITKPVAEIAASMEKVKQGDFQQRVEINRRDEIGFVGRTFNLMVEGLREREQIKDTFSRYVSRQVAEKILASKDRIELTGEKRMVTVLFSDIRGFTSMSERLLPEDIVLFLNEYFSVMVDIIFRYGGTLDKFIGDAIMAVYNAPAAVDMPELRAVITGLKMQEALAELNGRRIAGGKPAIAVGIGINTGEAVAGNIGSEKRLEYTVIGREVNLAQRIETKSGQGKVYISESTYAVVRDKVETRELDPVELKGIERKVRIYEVIRLTAGDPFAPKDRI